MENIVDTLLQQLVESIEPIYTPRIKKKAIHLDVFAPYETTITAVKHTDKKIQLIFTINGSQETTSTNIKSVIANTHRVGSWVAKTLSKHKEKLYRKLSLMMRFDEIRNEIELPESSLQSSKIGFYLAYFPNETGIDTTISIRFGDAAPKEHSGECYITINQIYCDKLADIATFLDNCKLYSKEYLNTPNHFTYKLEGITTNQQGCANILSIKLCCDLIDIKNVLQAISGNNWINYNNHE